MFVTSFLLLIDRAVHGGFRIRRCIFFHDFLAGEQDIFVALFLAGIKDHIFRLGIERDLRFEQTGIAVDRNCDVDRFAGFRGYRRSRYFHHTVSDRNAAVHRLHVDLAKSAVGIGRRRLRDFYGDRITPILGVDFK